jgi:hypothetical protein
LGEDAATAVPQRMAASLVIGAQARTDLAI